MPSFHNLNLPYTATNIIFPTTLYLNPNLDFQLNLPNPSNHYGPKLSQPGDETRSPYAAFWKQSFVEKLTQTHSNSMSKNIEVVALYRIGRIHQLMMVISIYIYMWNGRMT